MDKVAGSGNDEFFTPLYAVKPVFKYMRSGAKLWCPFDTEDSWFVKYALSLGFEVVATHINNGQDFFKTEVPAGTEYMVSNPPYSCKGEVLQRCFDLKVPFAMLVGVVGLFESKKRFEMFRDNSFEIMYFDKRVSYFQDYADQKPSLNPPFSSVYVCSGVLPKTIMFEEIDKKDLGL